MKTWLKGGLIGLGLFIIYFIIILIYFCSGGPFGGPEGTLSRALSIIPELFGNASIILVLITLLLLGSMIGLIISKLKIKNKK